MNVFSSFGEGPSFGFGDRIGLATPGHAEAMRRAGAGMTPVFAQQSIREMERTGRTPEDVARDALQGLERANWTAPSGADADHLKTEGDVDRTAAAGFVLFTIDPSEHVDAGAAHDDEATLRKKLSGFRDEVPWLEEEVGRSIELDDGTRIELDRESCLRCAVKYGRAVHYACRLGDHVVTVCKGLGREAEIELSVDETDEPTTLAEHWIIAEQCRAHGLPLHSLAPRFLGDFEKGVDFKGDRAAFCASLDQHAAIARALGGYKLSLHSGSDKLSIYPALARATKGKCHVKTAGTSYLEALRVAARRDPALFRRIVVFAREHFEIDRATYHLSATLDSVPPPEDVPDVAELESLYLERWADVPEGRGFTAPGRQIVHCTFGSVLSDETLGPALRSLLESEMDLYSEVLAEHFERHLRALGAGLG